MMNVSHPIGVLHSFSIKNIFYDKMDLRLFYFDVAICKQREIEQLFNQTGLSVSS